MVPWCVAAWALVVSLSLGVSLAAYARAVGGVYGLSLLCPCCWFVLICLYVG